MLISPSPFPLPPSPFPLLKSLYAQLSNPVWRVFLSLTPYFSLPSDSANSRCFSFALFAIPLFFGHWLSARKRKCPSLPNIPALLQHCIVSLILVLLSICRAGHATILPRQLDHVFRPQSCLLLQYYYIYCGQWLPYPHTETKIFFKFFLVPEALLRCRIVFVAKLYTVLSRAQLCPYVIFSYLARLSSPTAQKSIPTNERVPASSPIY